MSDIEEVSPPWRLLLNERVEKFLKEREWTNNENNLFRLRFNVRIGGVRNLACRDFQNSSIKHRICVGCEPTSAMPVLGSEGKPNIEVFRHWFWNAKLRLAIRIRFNVQWGRNVRRLFIAQLHEDTLFWHWL